jgi:hypothetical protein
MLGLVAYGSSDEEEDKDQVAEEEEEDSDEEEEDEVKEPAAKPSTGAASAATKPKPKLPSVSELFDSVDTPSFMMEIKRKVGPSGFPEAHLPLEEALHKSFCPPQADEAPPPPAKKGCR